MEFKPVRKKLRVDRSLLLKQHPQQCDKKKKSPGRRRKTVKQKCNGPNNRLVTRQSKIKTLNEKRDKAVSVAQKNIRSCMRANWKDEVDKIMSTRRDSGWDTSYALVHDRRSDIHVAIKRRDHEKVRELLENGETVCAFSSGPYSFSCFTLAYENPSWPVVKALIDFDPSIVNVGRLNFDQTFLTLFIHYPACVKYLLEKGANPHYCGFLDSNALNKASLLNAPLEVFQMLIDYGVDVNVKGKYHSPALFNASKKKDQERAMKIELLIEAGANDVNYQDICGRTGLMFCLESMPNEDIVSTTALILEKGYNVELTANFSGSYTVMHYLINSFKERLEWTTGVEVCVTLLDMLAQAGSDLHIKDRKGKTPLALLLDIHAEDSDAFPLVCQLLHYMKQTGYVYPRESNCHPHKLILEHLEDFNNNQNLHKILDLLLESPYICIDMTVVQTLNIFGVELESFILNTLGSVIMCLNDVRSLKVWVEKLLTFGFSVEHEDPKVLSPITVLLQSIVLYSDENNAIDEEGDKFKLKLQHGLVSVLQDLINNGGNVNQRIFKYKIPTMNRLSEKYLLPDSIWTAIVENQQLIVLIYLFSFWATHPLSLLLFTPPWPDNEVGDEEELHAENVVFALPAAYVFGGPLPHGTQLHRDFDRHILALSEKFPGVGRCVDLLSSVFQFCKRPPLSLKLLCRSAIRSCVETGNDLPQQIYSIVPPFLYDFVSKKALSFPEDYLNDYADA